MAACDPNARKLKGKRNKSWAEREHGPKPIKSAWILLGPSGKPVCFHDDRASLVSMQAIMGGEIVEGKR